MISEIGVGECGDPTGSPPYFFYDTEGNPIAAESVVDVTGDPAIQDDGTLTV